MENNVTVSDIQINITHLNLTHVSDGAVGYASFVLNDLLYVSFVAIYKLADGSYTLAYPKYRLGDSLLPVICPHNMEVKRMIEKAVIAKYEELKAQSD